MKNCILFYFVHMKLRAFGDGSLGGRHPTGRQSHGHDKSHGSLIGLTCSVDQVFWLLELSMIATSLSMVGNL